jgi:hypothetical protein
LSDPEPPGFDRLNPADCSKKQAGIQKGLAYHRMSKTHIRKKFFALVAGVAFLSAILTACAGSTPQPQIEPTGTAVATPGEVQRITPEEAKVAFDSGAAVFLDVRSHTLYVQSHIPGALSISLPELKPRIAELDPGQWIITYCT